jgi:hypothetical protein
MAQENGGQSKLEKAAIAARDSLLPINTYNGVAPDNQYSSTHTRAVADNLTPNAGKGTGNFLDIDNYAAGSALDINGNPSVAIDGGRNKALSKNFTTWGYDPTHSYKEPDMSGNEGQVII